MTFKIKKRHKFVIASTLLTLGLFSIQLFQITWRYQAIMVLSVFSYFLSAWALSEGLRKIKWLTILTLPFLFTAGVGLFYFLLPSTYLAKVPVTIIYGLGFYALLLTENIFSVASVRNIQLFRAANAVGFLLTLLAGFFLFNTILSFRFSFWLNFCLVFLVSFPLLVQGLWTVKLEENISKQIWNASFILSLVIAQISLALSFWPVSVSVGSLALVTIMYVALGLYQHQLAERLFKKTINEYVLFGAAVLLFIVFSTKWGG
jgi:hypothetical protein